MKAEIKLSTQLGPIASPDKDVAKLATGASVSLVGKIAGRGFNIASQIVLARFLGPTAFGLYALGLTVTKLIGLISPLGLDRGVLRYGSIYWRKDRTGLKAALTQSLEISFLVGIAAGALMFLSASWLAHQYRKPELTIVFRWFALSLPLLGGLKVAAAATRVSQRMKYAVIAEEIFQNLTNLLLIVFFCVMGWGLTGPLLANFISFLGAFLIALFFLKRLFPETFSSKIKSYSLRKDLIYYSLPTSLTNMFNMFLMWTDRLWVGYFRSEADVGIYQAAAQIATLFVIIVGAFGAILSPIIADLYSDKENQRLNDLYKVSTRWGLYLSMPIFLVIIFLPKDVMTAIFGAEYASGSLALIILAIGQLINLATGNVGPVLMMTGHQNRWLITSMIVLGVNFVMNWTLVPLYGLTGAAFSTGVTIGVLFISGLLQARWILNLWPYDRTHLNWILATLPTAIILFMIRALNIDPSILNFIVNMIVSVSVFSTTMLIFGLGPQDKDFIRSVRDRFYKGFIK